MAAKNAVKPARGLKTTLPWIIAGAAGIALVATLITGRKGGPGHPEPRPNAREFAAGVMPASFFASQPRVMRIYQMAHEIPETLDGLYCHCECKEHLGHRSLLTCYNSQHGAGCDVCLDEAERAYEMIQQGKPLAEIRVAIDAPYTP